VGRKFNNDADLSIEMNWEKKWPKTLRAKYGSVVARSSYSKVTSKIDPLVPESILHKLLYLRYFH